MPDKSWYAKQEKGSALLLKISFYLVYFLPKFLLLPIVFCIAFVYFLISKEERHNLKCFYKNLHAKFNIRQSFKKQYGVFWNFFEFSSSIVDKIAVWIGKITYKDLILENKEEIFRLFFDTKKRGKVVVVSHFGNIEIAKALGGNFGEFELAILVYDKNSLEFSALLNQLSQNKIKAFKVDMLDVHTMLELSTFVENGGLLCIMGDRIPLSGNKTCALEFLGEVADFPQGAFVIASLLKCEIWAFWCVKKYGIYHVRADFLSDFVKRKEICVVVKKYVELLEAQCKENPQMWFNFFDIWSHHAKLQNAS